MFLVGKVFTVWAKILIEASEKAGWFGKSEE
jgi:hypothetical protein